MLLSRQQRRAAGRASAKGAASPLAGPALRGFTRDLAERDAPSAVMTLPPHLRAAGLRLLRDHAPRWQLRDALEEAWVSSHAALLAGMPRAELLEMFRTADFDIGELPACLLVWRGGAGRSPAELAAGMAWTTSRDIAATYAVQHAQRFGGAPVLIHGTAPRSAVLFMDQTMGQSEVVLAAPPDDVEADPAPDLHAAAERGEAAYRAFVADLLADPEAVLLHPGARRIAGMAARQAGVRL